MQRSTDRILTTHAGSLSRPADLVALYARDASPAELEPTLAASVSGVVRQQVEAGVDVVNDGEFGKPTRGAVDYGAWWSYIYDRISGYERREPPPGTTVSFNAGSKDRADFRQFYQEDGGMGGVAPTSSAAARLALLVCTQPVKYVDTSFIQRDIANLRAALTGLDVQDAFIPAVSPATLQIVPNEHYSTPEDYGWALAEAIREEYRAIVDAGFLLQIDDPALVDLYDWQFSLTDDLAGYHKWAEFQVEP